MSDIRLTDYSLPGYRRSLGQDHRLWHALRLEPALTYGTSWSIVSQLDAPHGMVLGTPTDHVQRDSEPLDETQPMRVSLRWLYWDLAVAAGHLRVGQAPATWGSGLVWNDGNHLSAFGDPRGGTIVERLSYVGRALGSKVPVELLLATDLVRQDRRVNLVRGDLSARGSLGISYAPSVRRRAGLLLIVEQLHPSQPRTQVDGFEPKERTLTMDAAAQMDWRIPGTPFSGLVEGEAATVLGRTELDDGVMAPARTSSHRVARTGALVRVTGVGTQGAGERGWGRWGLSMEWGFASNDADPADTTDRRFTFHPSHRVGLILFDEVLRWKSARAAVAMDDSMLRHRPTTLGRHLPTEGGVAGATYLAPTILFRPVPQFDLRGGFVLAQATGDWVDPSQVAILGRYANYDGGSPKPRDLGLELDVGGEVRQALGQGITAALGVEGAALFPGRALADAEGQRIGTLGLARGRLSLYF